MHTIVRWLAAVALAITFCGNLASGQGAVAAQNRGTGCRSLLTFFGGSVTCYTATHAGEAASRLPVKAIDPRAAVGALTPLPLLQALVVQQVSGGAAGRVTALAYLFGVAPAHGGLACPGSAGPRYLLIEETPGRSGAAGIGTVCPGLWQGDAPGKSLSLHVVSNLSRAVVASLLGKLAPSRVIGAVASVPPLPVVASSTPTPTPAVPPSGGGSAGPPAMVGVPPSTPPALPAGVSRLLTEADDHGTIGLSVGDRALLALGGPYSWKVGVDDPTVVAQTDGPAPTGGQGIFQALAAGRAILTAIGSPICPSGHVCAQVERVFTAALVVEGAPASPTAIVSPSPATGSSVTITQADNGRVVPLAVGDHVLLDLGAPLNWDVQDDNPAVLAPLIGVLPIRGAQGIFEARADGSATLTATGGPICPPGQDCPQFPLAFKVTFVVGNAPPPTATATPTPGTPLTVTLADDGLTIPLAVGDRFLLDLGSDANWSVQIDDPSVIAPVPNVAPASGVAMIVGAQGIFEARADGSATLTATGTPICPNGQACIQLARTFRITLVVDGGQVPTQRTITLADNGKTLSLTVGDRFSLDLGGTSIWKVQVADPSVIAPLPTPLLPIPTQGLFEAVAPGTTTLTAYGDAPCRSLQPPCELPSLIFAITLVVGGPPPAQRTVTLADTGATLSLRTGDRFLLDLGGGYTWDVQILDPSVVAPVTGVLPIRGAQGLFEARSPGTTTLIATGGEPCLQATPPCELASIRFQITLVVDGGPPVGSPRTITHADNGRTITLKTGDLFLLALGGGLTWSVRIDDPSVVSQVAGVDTPNGSVGAVPPGGTGGVASTVGPVTTGPQDGTQGLFRAQQAGQTTLRAFSSPVCPGSEVCPAMPMVFSVNVVVQ